MSGAANGPPEDDPPDPAGPEDPVVVPIDGVLDLHTFDPAAIKDLLPEYLRACRERGILEARIVHGKGTGALRRTVHALLGRLPEVAAFRTAGEDAGGWGATLVTLRPPDAGSGGSSARGGPDGPIIGAEPTS